MIPLVACSFRVHEVFLSGLFFAWLSLGAGGCASDDPAGLRTGPVREPGTGSPAGLETATFSLG